MNSVFVDFSDLDRGNSIKGMVDIWNCEGCGTQVVFNGEKPAHTGTGTIPTVCQLTNK